MNKNLLRKIFSLGSLKARYGFILVMTLAGFGAAAQIAVTGRITSGEDASPIPGVNILVKGTTRGTITDAEGNYRIDVSGPDAVLVFSFVGYLTQEAVVGGRT